MPTGPLTIYNNLSVSDVIYDKAGNSTDWNNVYSSVASTSANWDNVYTSVSNTSANWDNVYTSVSNTSANWDNVYSSVASTSANWDNVYTSVSNTSANWDNVYTSVSNTSANWDNVYSSVASTSANWDTAYSTVCALSVSWEESAEIIPTVTNYLSTNNVLISSATVLDSVSAYGNIFATEFQATGSNGFTFSTPEIGSDTGMFNSSDGVLSFKVNNTEAIKISGGRVGIGSFLSGQSPSAGLHVRSGAIMPAIGNFAEAGIQFPNNPGGGGGDAAWIRYYSRAGEACNLELGIINDGTDHIVLMPSGSVGIGTTTPNEKLTVVGNISSTGSIAATNTRWDSTYSTVASLSGNWNLGYDGYTTLSALSSNWQNTFTSVQGASGNWDSVYSTVYTLSNSWEETADIIPTITNYLSTNNILISSATVLDGLQVNNNVLIYGNISATGTSNFANTVFSTTTAISVVHIGSGPAMWVGNDGTGDIASFYDIDQNIEILHVGGENSLAGPGVGIRTSYPNKALTVNGEISANSIIYDASGNSDNWNSVYTTTNSNSAYWNLGYDGYTVLNSNSANWDTVYSSVASTSANWDSTYTTVQSNSATVWNYQGEDLKALSADWVGGNIAYTNLIANSAAYLSGVDLSFLSVSANWDSVYTSVSNTSANWDNTYTTVQSNSATTWNYQGSDIKSLTADWVGGNSAFTTVQTNSSYWDSAYTTVLSNSAAWGIDTGSDVTLLSANWQNTYTLTNANSANWDSTYTTVQSNSSNWDNNTVITYVNSNFLYNTGGMITGNLTVLGSISATASYYGDGSNLTGIVAGDTEATTLVRSNSSFWQTGYDYGTAYSVNSSSYATTSLLNATSSQLVLTSDFDIYKTSVSAATAIFLPASIYQSASSNWENTYTTVYNTSANWNNVYSTVAANSATYVTTTQTTSPGLSAITKIVAVSALPATQTPGTLYIVM